MTDLLRYCIKKDTAWMSADPKVLDEKMIDECNQLKTKWHNIFALELPEEKKDFPEDANSCCLDLESAQCWECPFANFKYLVYVKYTVYMGSYISRGE